MLILVMSFSGSAVFLAILLSAVLGKRLVSSAWVYNMLKIDLIFFCLPLPIYNSDYKYIVSGILGIRKQWIDMGFTTGNAIGIEESGKIHLDFQTYIFAIWVVWVCGLLLVFAENVYKYIKAKAQKANPQMCKANYLEIFDRIKKELGIRKRITLLCASDIKTVCTIGIFQKYIIIPERDMTDEEIYYSLKHELLHVKRADVAWRYIGVLAVLMHWFNPLVYLYLYVMSIYCEQSCDAILVQNLDKTERKKYGELIINMSQDEEFGKWKYQTYLSGSKKIIEWRLKSMLKVGKRKRIKGVVSLMLGATILFGGSLTVCAYEYPQVIWNADAAMFKQSSDEQITRGFITEEIRFSEEEVLDFAEFVGEDGTRYDLSEEQSNNMGRADCAHSYVSGYYADHHKNSDGSCRTDYYYAERCTKCGAVQKKGYSHTETSTKCTH